MSIVKCARTTITAIALVVAMIGAASVPAVAVMVHPVCAANQHDCGSNVKVTKCCCRDARDTSSQNGPVQSRVAMRADLTAHPFVVVAAASGVRCGATRRSRIARRASPVDLPTLFASLLI